MAAFIVASAKATAEKQQQQFQEAIRVSCNSTTAQQRNSAAARLQHACLQHAQAAGPSHQNRGSYSRRVHLRKGSIPEMAFLSWSLVCLAGISQKRRSGCAVGS